MPNKYEKIDKVIEWLRGASMNCDNVDMIGTSIIPLIKSQIDNSVKYLRELTEENENGQ